jgi:hypothetical protein
MGHLPDWLRFFKCFECTYYVVLPFNVYDLVLYERCGFAFNQPQRITFLTPQSKTISAKDDALTWKASSFNAQEAEFGLEVYPGQ